MEDWQASNSGRWKPWIKKKSKRTTPCVFCKGDHHPARCTSKLKPNTIACFNCGKPGHKSNECPDKAGGSANAITDAIAKKSLPVSSGTCPRCHRGNHLEADCTTKECWHCGSLSAHDWNKCDGTAKSFYLRGSTEIEVEKIAGENPQLTTYSVVVKKAIKPRIDTKFFSLGTMNRYSVFDTYRPHELDSLSPKKKSENELVSHALSADEAA